MEINKKARESLWTEVEGLSGELLNKKSSEDRWSIGQILEHLYLIEKGFVRMIQKQLDIGEKINAEDQPIELTLNRSYKVQAPEFSVPSDTFKELDTLKEQLDSSQAALEKLEKTANRDRLVEKGLPHPAFGHLNLKQAIEFVGYHEMRHVEQIREVKEELGLLEKQ